MNDAMKHTTKNGRKKFPKPIGELITRTTGLSAEIARVGGTSQAFVSMVLSGHRQPSQRFLNALAEVLFVHGEKYLNAAAGVALAELICEYKGHITALRQ